MDELSKNITWTGTHKGVRYQVSHHGEGGTYRPEGAWCYYILVHEDQLDAEWLEKLDLPPKADDKGRINYPYMASWWAGLDWHCGITFYKKTSGVDGAKKMFKVGCDYAHYWDEGHYYNLESVAHDARTIIDELVSRVPLRVRCSWDGCYAALENMTAWGKGHINNGCIEGRNAAFPKAEPIVAALVSAGQNS